MNTPREQSSVVLRECAPVLLGDSIDWNCRQLGVKGRWSALGSAIDHCLLESSGGSVRWRCLQSGSRVNLTDSNIGPLTGLGYVECLEMTIKPWELPIDELRWGRFVSKTDQIVWIEWRGECPHLMIYHNGLQVSGGSISEEAVQLGDGLVLELTDQLVLREGRIGSTALASMTILKRIVPRRILKIYERKWRSRGVLRREGAELCRGWIIHEVVKF